MADTLRRWGSGPCSRPSAFYWPTGRVDVALTPREAWSALLAREITAEEFGDVLKAWEAA